MMSRYKTKIIDGDYGINDYDDNGINYDDDNGTMMMTIMTIMESIMVTIMVQ